MSIKKTKRAISKEKSTKVTSEMKLLAAEYHRENNKANKAKAKADKARKALYSKMKESGIKSFDLITSIEGVDVRLETEVASPPREHICVTKLSKIVSSKQLLEIISASKKSVIEKAGTDVATRCSVSGFGTENVSVKIKK